MVLGVGTKDAFKTALMWKGIVSRRRFGPWLLSVEELQEQARVTNRSLQMTDARVREGFGDPDGVMTGSSPSRAGGASSREAAGTRGEGGVVAMAGDKDAETRSANDAGFFGRIFGRVVGKKEKSASSSSSAAQADPPLSPEEDSSGSEDSQELPLCSLYVADLPFFTHRAIDNCGSVNEYIRGMCASSCIVPFFVKPVRWKNLGLCVDGAFGGCMAIPREYRRTGEAEQTESTSRSSQVIRLAAMPWPLCGLEKPDIGVSWRDVFNFLRAGRDYYVISSKERCLAHFRLGYEAAAAKRDVLLAKGLPTICNLEWSTRTITICRCCILLKFGVFVS